MGGHIFKPPEQFWNTLAASLVEANTNGMSRLLTAAVLAVGLAVVPLGTVSCAAMQKADTQFVQAADALQNAASAMSLLDLVLSDYLQALDAPTPEELLNASKAVEALSAARSELLEARVEAERLHLTSASRHVLAALEQLEKASKLMREAGVDVPTSVDRFIVEARRLAERGAQL